MHTLKENSSPKSHRKLPSKTDTMQSLHLDKSHIQEQRLNIIESTNFINR